MKEKSHLPSPRVEPEVIVIQGAREHNLDVEFLELPKRKLLVLTGVSGSGKSSLAFDTLYAEGQRRYIESLSAYARQFLGQMEKPRYDPATYTKAFDLIRELFARTQEARTYGYAPGRFSFNLTAARGGGRCEACGGAGLKEVEMHFLPNVFVTCEVCHGRRYNDATLRVTYRGRNIANVLDTPIEEAFTLFRLHRKLGGILQTLLDVGLGYVSLGQAATTLSGGEAQRVKLARELSKRQTGRTLYLLDEPTCGLHFDDIRNLLQVLSRLVDSGNTVIVIEHNLDVIKTADWVLDLGPEGSERGGTVVAVGTPEQVAGMIHSHTGQHLEPLLLGRRQVRSRPLASAPERAAFAVDP